MHLYSNLKCASARKRLLQSGVDSIAWCRPVDSGRQASPCREAGGACADYVRLMKYGDSLYRCKQLKRAAMVRCRSVCPLMSKPYAHSNRVLLRWGVCYITAFLL